LQHLTHPSTLLGVSKLAGKHGWRMEKIEGGKRLINVCSHLSCLPAVATLSNAATVHVVGCFKNQLSNVSQSLSTQL